MVGKGHCINGQTYYCGREYPPITRNFGVLQDEFRESTFIPIHVEGCPACEAWKEGWQKLNGAYSLGLSFDADAKTYSLDSWLRALKPFYRFYYQCIVRGQEDEGIQILSAGRQLHQQIIDSLAAGYPFRLPRKTKWQEFKCWVRSWFGYVEPKLNLLDWKYGANLLVCRVMGSGSWNYRFPDYQKSHFDSEPKPAGDIFQIQEWKSKLVNLEEYVRLDDFSEIRDALAASQGYRSPG